MNGPNTAGQCCGRHLIMGGSRCLNCPTVAATPNHQWPNMGWQCPKCGRGNAPFVHQCPCGPAYVSWASATVGAGGGGGGSGD